ncbi:beta-lactamase/transpeptidase-like protein [Paraphoma chrysanthemicola]|uniref:Beta-lactamase/transpeptidase-like protein n=1 Tax=Paraphoma chrysanthemicola TaxID=798071 RepID=A0A8K0VTQ9_9PLEO|nr:beta-lactamase/transpeptidase-like protein [Paraphoma chrysanthemicola]
MNLISVCTISAVLAFATAVKGAACPPLGPVFPQPTNLVNSSAFQTALKNLTASLDLAFKTQNSSYGAFPASDTYSIQVFSSSDHASLWEYYRRGANLSTSSAPTINGDTVFRIGSASKLLAVYTLLVEAGDHVFADPVTKYVPELEGKDIWDDVTIGSITAHLAGIFPDVIDLSTSPLKNEGFQYPDAYPRLSADEEEPCQANITVCTRSKFLKSLESSRFSYLPNTTPAYSNGGFALLGYVIESITGKSFEDALKSALVEPLGLTHTTGMKPNVSHIGAIKFNESYSAWTFSLTGATAEGGIYSSANDLSAIGRSMLNSTLLSSNTTRGWLKPVTFTSSLTGAVGRPWEIFRAPIGPTSNNRVIDVYTKGGSLPSFETMLAVIPDFNVGFTILISTAENSGPNPAAELILDIILPVLDEVGRQNANATISGTYTATGSLNSSVTISSSPNNPGLSLDRWISNGTDMLMELDPSAAGMRLYPSNVDAGNSSLSAWKAEVNKKNTGPYGTCTGWFNIGRPEYGRYSLDDWVFTLASNGKAESLAIKAMKVVLNRSS